MTRKIYLTLPAALSCAAFLFAPAVAQEAETAVAPVSDEAAEAPAVNEDEMADKLNSQQQIKQDVTLTRSVDGKVIETRKETIVYSKDDPIRDTEAGMSPLEKLKAQFDSQVLTREEAIDEARLDFVVADLDRNDAMNAAEFVFLVKGWEEAEIAGVGGGRFVEPFFHVDPRTAAEEHAELARAKFANMAGEVGAVSRKKFVRMVVEEFEKYDADKDGLLRGDELLNFRAAVRGEPIDAPAGGEISDKTQ